MDVEIEVDNEPRAVEAPPALAAALAEDKAADRTFVALSNSKKRLFVEPIEQAESEETRNRRVAKAIEKSRQGSI